MTRNLRTYGITVPDGFAATAAYWSFIDSNGLRRPISAELAQVKRKAVTLTAGAKRIYHTIARAQTLLLLLTLALVTSMGGCGFIHLKPDSEVTPSQESDQVWMPPRSTAGAVDALSQLRQLRHFDESGIPPASRAQGYDLPSLVDLALRISPQTRHAWYVALEAEAQLGQSEAPNYPQAETKAEGGYAKLPLEFPGQTLDIRNDIFLPQFKVSYDLLDFGRTRANERSAREQLIAANYNFNQAIQDLVFQVERAYYTLSAAIANVSAAEANLKLARISLASVEQRHQVGLATKPQVLLAKHVEAQAIYDLESAKSTVHDAEAGLRQAVGVAADADIRIQSGQLDRLPKSLGDDVETMMTDALKQRPDIAAKVAAVRAGDAAIARARAEYYPEVDLSGNYGQVIWSYTVNGGHTQDLNQPFYGAIATIRWNLFTGFDRYYGVKKATAERDAARSELRSLQIDSVAAVWTAYYDYLSAKKKRDAAETLLTSSEESFAANYESHRYGLATITDLISSERDLMAARYTLIQSKADLLISACAVVHATGAATRSSARIP